MIHVNYEGGTAVVSLVSEITDEAVIELAAVMRHLRRECFYDCVHLEIASPGGAETALSYWLDAAEELRGDGLRIVTRGLTVVGSAAALILSLGDWREAKRNARLLYHGARIDGSQPLTAEAAAHQAGWMGRLDGDMAAGLAARALEAPARELGAGALSFEDRLVADHLANGVDWPERSAAEAAGEPAGGLALSRLRRLVAWCAEGPAERFAALYRRLLRLDRTISPALALELALIDRIADGRGGSGPERPEDAFRVPQWSALFPSGEVSREALCRHVLVLGEPGSGKTASAILPAVAAACDPANRVGCALVIDPKKEIKDVVVELAGDDLRVFEPGLRGGVRQVIDVMASPEWSVEADLAAGRVKAAARKMLLRSASLAPASPAATLNGAPGKARDPYWEVEGGKLAMTALATALALLGGDAPPSPARGADKDFQDDLLRYRRLAGLAEPAAGADARDCPPNALALANHVLAKFFAPERCQKFAEELSGCFGEEPEGDLPSLAEDVGQWSELAVNTTGGHYMGVHTMARQAFGDFGDGTPARTLYFGCEPGLKAGLASGSMAAVSFGRDVDADGGRAVHVYQPSLGASRDALVAKALKAAYFEAILGSAKRSVAGHGMPLAAYVADEAHRFVTCDAAHGEQSFMDACRSFGAFCVLATQSCSSLRHALGEFSFNGAAEHAVEMLLANTATKLFFRSTDGVAMRHVRDLCPLTPGRPSVADVRPPSTLRPGECYAVLADGRMERRRLDPLVPGGAKRGAPTGGGRASAAEPGDADSGPFAEVQRLLGAGWSCGHRPGGEPPAAGDDLFAMSCEARHRGGRLVVHVDVDRGARSILVGTGQPDDMHPFEDLAVHRGWLEEQGLRGMADEEGVRPLMPLEEALRLLGDNADGLDAGFAPGNTRLRRGLREVADRSHAAWDRVAGNP